MLKNLMTMVDDEIKTILEHLESHSMLVVRSTYMLSSYLGTLCLKYNIKVQYIFSFGEIDDSNFDKTLVSIH